MSEFGDFAASRGLDPSSAGAVEAYSAHVRAVAERDAQAKSRAAAIASAPAGTIPTETGESARVPGKVETGIRNLGADALAFGVPVVGKPLVDASGLRVTPQAPVAPAEEPAGDNGLQKPAEVEGPWSMPAATGGAARAPMHIGDVAVQGQTPTYSPEAAKAYRQSLETSQLANTYGQQALTRAEEERHRAEDLIAKNQAAYDKEARRLEERRVAEYNAFQDRLEAKKAEAREQAPARAISSLFSAVAIGMGAYASSITKTPNVALDLYKHAADEEARRLERAARDENNYYHRMLQEFGDKKQALAMTKLGFLEQGKAAMEKASANAKTDFAREQYLRSAAQIQRLQGDIEHQLHMQKDPPKTLTTNQGIFAGQDPRAVGAATAATAQVVEGELVGGKGAPAPAAEAAGTAAPPADDTPLGRLGALWEKKKAETPEAVGQRLGESAGQRLREAGREAGAGLVKRFGAMFGDDAPVAKAGRPASSGWSAPASAQLAAVRSGRPLLAPDGLPMVTPKEEEAGQKQYAEFLKANDKLVDGIVAARAFESAINRYTQKDWAEYTEMANALDRERTSVTLGDRVVGKMHGNEDANLRRQHRADEIFAKWPAKYKQMHVAAKAMVNNYYHAVSGAAVTDKEEPRLRAAGLATNDIPSLITSYNTNIRAPLWRKWRLERGQLSSRVARRLADHAGGLNMDGVPGEDSLEGAAQRRDLP